MGICELVPNRLVLLEIKHLHRNAGIHKAAATLLLRLPLRLPLRLQGSIPLRLLLSLLPLFLSRR
jgi:hypothetical protein